MNLEQFTVKNLFDNIYSDNQTISFDGVNILPIPLGNYSISDLLTAINANLVTALISLVLSYDALTTKIVFTNTSGSPITMITKEKMSKYLGNNYTLNQDQLETLVIPVGVS